MIIVPITEVRQAKLVRQPTGRRPLSARRHRRRCEQSVHGCCSRARRYGDRDGSVVEASSCARRRRRASLWYGRWRRVVLGVGMAGRRAQCLRHALVLSVGRRVWGRRRGHGLFMAGQVLSSHRVDGHLRLLGRILHAWSPAPSPLLRIVRGGHWRASYGRGCIRRGRGVRKRGERA